jgi:hypothetical protein
MGFCCSAVNEDAGREGVQPGTVPQSETHYSLFFEMILQVSC